MDKKIKNAVLIEKLTLFFGGFLLFTDVFFLLIGINADMPIIRNVIYVKLVINTTNIYLILNKHYLVSTIIICTVIMGFMITGLVCVGPEAEFQLYALGMLACISYSGYLHNRVLKKELPFVMMLAIHVALYVLGYIYARTHEPIYQISDFAMNILIAFNSAATFGIVIIYMVLFHNVAIHSEEKLEKMALIDNLTELYNRNFLLTSMEHMEVGSPEDRWLAILDIDDFKKVNDTYGHDCGDKVLVMVADTISSQMREGDFVCRWGGEEILILVNGNLEAAKALGDRILEKICANEVTHDNKTIKVTMTFGVAEANESLRIEDFIQKADNRLYYGKSHGKCQVVAQIPNTIS